jgi:MFS transporter, AAHS family, 4-hydroxybenzoate transporter
MGQTRANCRDRRESVGSLTAAIDIAEVLDQGRWTRYQRFLTVVSALAIIFDGFDIQILGFAIPTLMKEWALPRAAFGPVLALGLAGMAVGSPFAGYLGDRAGRRPALIFSLILFAAATLATSFVASIAGLAVLRFLTGLGTGGALPNATALVAEFAPRRHRPMAVKLTLVCVPLGGMLGGLIAARVLPSLGWRALYLLGGLTPLAFAVFLWFALPESPRFLAQDSRRWPALERLLRKMGRAVAPSSAFCDTGERSAHRIAPLRALLGPAQRRDTAGLWLAFFFCLGSIYLVFGWLPAMLTARGIDMASASRGLAVYNLGGVAGVFVWAALVTALGSRRPLLSGALAAAGSAIAILLVPAASGSAGALLLAGLALNGLLANAVQTSMYALAAHIYPTSVRASGIAYAAGIGRAGGIVSSIGGAAIIAAGPGAYWGTLAVSMVIAFAGLAWVRGHIPAIPASPGIERSSG